MPRIRCHYLDCVFLDEGYCSAAQVEIDPDTGCNTYSPNAEAASGEDWAEDEEDELDEWEEGDDDEEDDDGAWGEESEEEF